MTGPGPVTALDMTSHGPDVDSNNYVDPAFVVSPDCLMVRLCPGRGRGTFPLSEWVYSRVWMFPIVSWARRYIAKGKGSECQKYGMIILVVSFCNDTYNT